MSESILSQSYLKSIFEYDPETGVLTWKFRPDVPKEWNTRFADKEAGYINNSGYRLVRIDGAMYLAHRIIWCLVTGEFPEQIDHIYHDRQNNRWSNLRDVTAQENNKNRTMQSNNDSGFTGVCWDKHARKWKAYIRVDGKQNNLGMFSTKVLAILARKQANIDYDFHTNHGSG